jgi:uncharacterized protein
VKQFTNGYIGNRVLKLNVGFLLASGPGRIHDTAFDVPAVRVSDDVFLNYIRGSLRLSRTKEGILVQGNLQVGVEDECSRCLDPVASDVTVELEELYAYPALPDTEFSMDDTGILDLAPLLREEVLITNARVVLCRPDCKGLCPTCGTNFNHGQCDCAEKEVDPRMAKLRELLDAQR